MMSVLLNCQPGDEIVCIEAFHASPDGESFSWDTSRRFRVGERLLFVGARQDPHFKDGPNGWHVIFEVTGGKRYAAVQTYFVTDDCWARVKRYFARRLLREPKRTRSSKRP